MTGFGRARAAGEQLDVTVEINSVNRRNLEVAVALPREWQVLERGLTERVRAGLQRGRIQVSVQIDRRSENERLHWDENAVRSILLRLEELAARRGIDFQPDASLLFKIAERVPAPQEELDTEAVAQLVQMAVDDALEEVLAMRRREGRVLADDLEGRADTLAHLLREVGSRSKSVVPRYRKILLERLQYPGLELDLNDERVLREIALFADRCDISEEVTRLGSHLLQFRETLSAAGPMGRKLEFLMQEINREFNTVGAKANDLEITGFVLEAKGEIERVREQVQNVE